MKYIKGSEEETTLELAPIFQELHMIFSQIEIIFNFMHYICTTDYNY